MKERAKPIFIRRELCIFAFARVLRPQKIEPHIGNPNNAKDDRVRNSQIATFAEGPAI
jgi:hypothetical protein